MLLTPLRQSPLRFWIVAVVLALTAVVCAGNAADPDLWGHVKYGRDALAAGRLPVYDPYSYDGQERPWINHEVLAELWMGWLESRVGIPALVLWKVLVGVSITALAMALNRRQSISVVGTLILAGLVVLNLRPGWAIRPQVWTFGFFAVLLAIFDLAERRSERSLWAAVPLIALWANTHGGFLMGLGVLGAYLGCAMVGAVRALDRLEPRSGLRRIGLLCGVGLAALGAPLLNPYGFGLVQGLAYELGLPRPEIPEWYPVPLLGFGEWHLKLLALVVVGALLASRRPRRAARVVILGLLVFESFAHVRHGPFLAIAAAFWLPEPLQDALNRLPAGRSAVGAGERWGLGRALLAGLTLALAAMAAGQVSTIRVRRDAYPVDALRFVRDRGLRGRVVVDFNWAQYVIYACDPDLKVSFDGRFRTCYSQEVLVQNFEFIHGAGYTSGDRRRTERVCSGLPADRVLDRGAPNLAILCRTHPRSTAAIARRPDWTLLYRDRLAEVWGRASLYDNPDCRSYLPARLRVQSDRPVDGWVAYPALPGEGGVARIPGARGGMLGARASRPLLPNCRAGGTPALPGELPSGRDARAPSGASRAGPAPRPDGVLAAAGGGSQGRSGSVRGSSGSYPGRDLGSTSWLPPGSRQPGRRK